MALPLLVTAAYKWIVLLQCIVDVDDEWTWSLGWMVSYSIVLSDVHTSLIYVEKSVGYKMVSTALAKKLRTGNID